MSEYSYKDEIGFSVDEFPGCCGITVICRGTAEFDEMENASVIDDFEEFLDCILDGEGVILFTDNPGGPLDFLYDKLDPSGTHWEKRTFCEFRNPNSGNQVVIKALVKT